LFEAAAAGGMLFEERDERFMRMALDLARKGEGVASPNPMVGAVVVKDDRVVGSGWYRGPGQAHAERVAFEEAAGASRGATLFVTLEPCVHQGKTPPCTEAVLEAGIARVVAAMKDPDSRVAGGGFERLRKSGVDVSSGPLQAEAAQLNEAYVTHRTENRPFVIFKTAITLDGRVAARDGSSQWITGEEARRDVHLLRARCDAICVGVGSVLADDPALTARVPHSGKEPLRVVVDSHGRTPPEAKVFSGDAPSIVYTAGSSDGSSFELLEERGAVVQTVESEMGRVSIKAMLEDLAKRNVLSLLLEGGPTIAGAFASADLIDKYVFYIAPKLLGDEGLPAIKGWTAQSIDMARELDRVSVEEVGEDIRVIAYPSRNTTDAQEERG
jgi:diaminohydroxyphosphoribosylaminopyrimidine deaminase/5-amino-6-(5-phosphoribosylamino)uracil reductase